MRVEILSRDIDIRISSRKGTPCSGFSANLAVSCLFRTLNTANWLGPGPVSIGNPLTRGAGLLYRAVTHFVQPCEIDDRAGRTATVQNTNSILKVWVRVSCYHLVV